MIKKSVDFIFKLDARILFLIFLLSRISFLIAYYPGLMIWDTGSSIAQFYGFETHVISVSSNPDAILSNHHMILLTFLMGGAVKLGELIGNQNFGFFLYTSAQMLLTNAVVAYGLHVLRKKSFPILYVLAVAIYALHPLFSIWQITVSKDSLFSVFLLLLIILLYQIVESNGTLLRKRKFLLLLTVANLMVILTKPQGAYISLLTFLVVAFVCRKQWKKILCCGILPSILYLTLFTGVLLPALNVAASGKQEMLGFAFQQTARYVRDHGEDVTDAEQKAIAAVLPYDDLAQLYSPHIQDPVKFCYSQTATDEELMDYLKAWAGMFLKHPQTYLAATWDNIRHFFVPLNNWYSYFPVLLENSNILKEHSVFTLHNTKIQPFYSIVSVVTEKLATSLPTFIFFQPCFYVWLTMIVCVILLVRRNISAFVYLAPIVFTSLVLLIAPCVDIRYVLPMVYCAPVFLMIVFEKKKERQYG